jgi:hypothetical protein
MINQLPIGTLSIEGSYLQKFQIAQRNLELVCEEYKGTKLCKRQHVWHERKGYKQLSGSIR